MKAFQLVLALFLGASLLAVDVAWADRGGRGGHQFSQRHDGFTQRHHGLSSRQGISRPRHEAFSSRHESFRHRHGPSSPRHDAFKGGTRIVPAHGGHRIHRRSSVGVFVGVPLVWHWPPPYYAYPPTIVTVPAQPPVYIEREYEEAPPDPRQGYWYYCHDPEGYYPYVRECPGGWERVAPVPPR